MNENGSVKSLNKLYKFIQINLLIVVSKTKCCRKQDQNVVDTETNIPANFKLKNLFEWESFILLLNKAESKEVE